MIYKQVSQIQRTIYFFENIDSYVENDNVLYELLFMESKKMTLYEILRLFRP